MTMRTCRDCKQDLPLDRFIAIVRRYRGQSRPSWTSYCKPCHCKRTGESHKRHRAAVSANAARWRAAHPVAAKAAQKKRRAKMRDLIFAAYGESCACCGETMREFLAVDHTLGGGLAHRRSLHPNGKAGGNTFYQWLINNKFPPGFRILCHNCNQAKGHYGVCPHEVAAYDVPYAVRMDNGGIAVTA